MEPISKLLERLKQSGEDVRAQAAIVAEHLVPNSVRDNREQLKSALDGAAILRFFETNLLAGVLDIPKDDALLVFNSLCSLPFVEQYNKVSGTFNLHESTRLG